MPIVRTVTDITHMSEDAKGQLKHVVVTVFSLAKSLQLVLGINAINRLLANLLADKWVICRLRAQPMISSIKLMGGKWHLVHS